MQEAYSNLARIPPASSHQPLVLVSVEVVSQVDPVIWRGSLPATVTMQQVQQVWTDLAGHFRTLPPYAALRSGPWVISPESTLAQVLSAPEHTRLVRRKTGHLALTFHPPIHGGGSKVDATNATRSRLATILLQHGVLLN